MNKKTYREMISEGLCEAGTLLIVFGPIACIFEGRESGSAMHIHVMEFILLGLSTFGAGAILRAKRWQDR